MKEKLKKIRFNILKIIRFWGSAAFYKTMFIFKGYVPTPSESKIMEETWKVYSYHYWTRFKIWIGWDF